MTNPRKFVVLSVSYRPGSTPPSDLAEALHFRLLPGETERHEIAGPWLVVDERIIEAEHPSDAVGKAMEIAFVGNPGYDYRVMVKDALSQPTDGIKTDEQKRAAIKKLKDALLECVDLTDLPTEIKSFAKAKLAEVA